MFLTGVETEALVGTAMGTVSMLLGTTSFSFERFPGTSASCCFANAWSFSCSLASL
jgi:hypothetical protein